MKFLLETARLVENFLRPLGILEFASSDAVAYAGVRAKLERAGTPIGPLDTLLAAQAVARKLILVTNNEREFRRVVGLHVQNWTPDTERTSICAGACGSRRRGVDPPGVAATLPRGYLDGACRGTMTKAEAKTMTRGSTTATRDVVTRFYERLGAGAVADVAALFADPVDWYIPGNEAVAPWLGRRTRSEEVEAFFRLLLSSIDPLRADVQHMLVDGDVAIVSGEFASRMHRTGKVYESMFFAHFTVRDGLIIRYRLLEDTHGLVAAMTE